MQEPRNALLVYPRFPPSYWDFRYAIELMGKKSTMPPLGLITVAAMFPSHYRLRLVDTNVEALTDRDLDWADLVLTSTMVVQRRSLQELIARCHRHDKPVVVGGPHPTAFADEIGGADFYVLDEVEEVLPCFLTDWETGRANRMYRPERKPPLEVSPTPRFDLLDLGAYSSMALQFSRGCPFNCEFCDITQLFGRVPRTKPIPQMLDELDALFELGWRGPVFLVDDNFIGNRREALRLLPQIAAWQRARAYPFDLFTEASVNLALHEPLMDAMVDAGFSMVFVGIESPNPRALELTRKLQNLRRGEDDYLLGAVRSIQRKGLEVSAGFILGLDGDGPEVFDAQIDFIQRAGIPRAMVGLLSPLRGTDLYSRLEAEGRLLGEATGNNVAVDLDFRPELEPQVLIDGYRRVLATLYDPGLVSYFDRCWTLIANLGRGVPGRRRRYETGKLLALLHSLRHQVLSRQAPAYLAFLLRTLARRPRHLPLAIRLAIMGLHFEKYTLQTLTAHDFSTAARADYDHVERQAASVAAPGTEILETLGRHADRARRRLRRLHLRLRPEFRENLMPDLAAIDRAIQACVREAPALELLQRLRPRIETWFAGASWREILEARGYAPAECLSAPAPGAGPIALFPLLPQGRWRRAFEHFFSELGVQVMSFGEQVAQIGRERLEGLLVPGEDPERLLSYLRALGGRADALVLPLSWDLPDQGARIQVLSASGTSRGAHLPHVVRVACRSGRRQLHASLIELGAAFTGDPLRSEVASDRAVALL